MSNDHTKIFLTYNGDKFEWKSANGRECISGLIPVYCGSCDIPYVTNTEIIYDGKIISIPTILTKCACP